MGQIHTYMNVCIWIPMSIFRMHVYFSSCIAFLLGKYGLVWGEYAAIFLVWSWYWPSLRGQYQLQTKNISCVFPELTSPYLLYYHLVLSAFTFYQLYYLYLLNYIHLQDQNEHRFWLLNWYRTKKNSRQKFPKISRQKFPAKTFREYTLICQCLAFKAFLYKRCVYSLTSW